MEVVIKNLSEIKINPNNPRKIEDAKFKKLVQSLKDFPDMLKLRPIVVDTKMVVLGGNMRLKAAEAAGMASVPITVADLTPEQEKEFIIKDNVGYGEWEWDMLANEWDEDELKAWALDLPVNFGVGEIEEDNFQADPPENPITKLGDIYELNQHRFSCGDSCDPSVVAKTLAGAKPILMVTDPPYGVNYDPEWRHRAGIIDSSRTGKVTNDDNARWLDAYLHFKGDIAYCWCASQRSAEVHADLCEAGFIPNYQIIWNKQQATFGRGDYHWKHEPCWYFTRKGAKHNWQGSRKETTVWDITSILQSSNNLKEDEAQTHGTQKPVECMARPIRNNTHLGESVYDPFLGSGTTIIAADQLNRACYGQELYPAYCDMIVARFIKFKCESEFTIKRNGLTLSKKEIQKYLINNETTTNA